MPEATPSSPSSAAPSSSSGTSSPPSPSLGSGAAPSGAPAASPGSGSQAKPAAPKSSPLSTETGSGEGGFDDSLFFGNDTAETAAAETADVEILDFQSPVPSAPEAVAVPGPQSPVAESLASQTPQPQSPRTEGPSALDPSDPMSLLTAMQENEAVLVQETARQLFALSPEEVEALEINAAEAVPQLLARAYVASQKNLLMQMSRIVPSMVQKVGDAIQRNQAAEGKFYSRWPQLDASKHGAMVKEMAVAWRRANPQATLEQMIEGLGPYVLMAARVQPQAPAAPARQAAFVPGGASVGVASIPQPSQPGLWDYMGFQE